MAHEYPDFIEAVRLGETEEVEEHLKAHPEFLHHANKRGWTPLHFAAANGNSTTVELLLRLDPQRGCVSLDRTTKYGTTPLHLAASAGYDAMVEVLIRFAWEYGSSSVDQPNSHGTTALDLAAMNGHDSTTRILKAVGAIALHRGGLLPDKLRKFQEPISEEAVLAIRFRIYFRHSLLSRLLLF